MTTATAQAACPRCNASVAAGAQFCGSCGASLSAAQTPPQPPPYVPPPPMPQMARGVGAGSGPAQQASIGAPQPVAFAQALRVLQTNNAEVGWQQAPHSAKFLLTRKSFWSTAGVALKYDGDLSVQSAGPDQSTVRFALKLQWNSAIPLLALQVLAVIVAAMLNPYFAYFALILIIVTLAITAWNASSGIPEKALKDLVSAVQSGAPIGAAAPVYSPQPAAAPIPPAPVPAAPAPPVAAAPPATGTAPSSDTATVVEQIKQLAGLRDAGAITPEEFEAKKAELLKRI